MKNTIFTIALVLMSYFGFAQTFSEELKSALKKDDPTALLSEIKAKKLSLNDCFDIDGTSYSLFAISIRMDKPKILETLISNKADLNKVCNDKTPLMYAAKYGKLEAAKALVKAGADLKIANQDKETALDYAIKYKNKELETYLTSLKTK